MPDAFAKLLFRMSSVLPFQAREIALKYGHKVSPDTRGFMFQASGQDLIEFLEIGTRMDRPLR